MRRDRHFGPIADNNMLGKKAAIIIMKSGSNDTCVRGHISGGPRVHIPSGVWQLNIQGRPGIGRDQGALANGEAGARGSGGGA